MTRQLVARRCAEIAVQLSGRANNNVLFAGRASGQPQFLPKKPRTETTKQCGLLEPFSTALTSSPSHFSSRIFLFSFSCGNQAG